MPGIGGIHRISPGTQHEPPLTYPTFIVCNLDLPGVTKFDHGSNGDVKFSTRLKVQPHIITLQQKKKGNPFDFKQKMEQTSQGSIHKSAATRPRRKPTCCTMTMVQSQVIGTQSFCREKNIRMTTDIYSSAAETAARLKVASVTSWSQV